MMKGLKMDVKESECSHSGNVGLSLRGQVEVKGNRT